jgi:hypothetical protein
MSAPTGSYAQVFYDLRPAKQVERRMLIDAFHRLLAGGFALRDYQYTGFGSIYFVDFILLHRLVGLHRLLSLEFDQKITQRVAFNQPFGLVNIEMQAAGDVIPTLERDLQHILWLDYDYRLTRSVVSDVSQAAYRLSPGSILLVTVDIKAPDGRVNPTEWREYYEEQAGEYFNIEWTADDFGESDLAKRVVEIVAAAIREGLSGRKAVRFAPLFHFIYADGHPMLTAGGMIITDTEERKLGGCDFSDANFMRFNFSDDPFVIRVPRLTRKERLYLDANMPCPDGWLPEDFELTSEETLDYRAIYRYYPTYAELVL